MDTGRVLVKLFKSNKISINKEVQHVYATFPQTILITVCVTRVVLIYLVDKINDAAK